MALEYQIADYKDVAPGLISRRTAIKLLCECVRCHIITDFDAVASILMAPIVEPEPKSGRWIWNPNGMDWNLGAWCCSECRTKAETWWANDEKYNPLMCSGGKFCGNCGADMRGKQDGKNTR